MTRVIFILRSLSHFNFSSTVGFGAGFFEKLKIKQCNRPTKLYEMPTHSELGDPEPYVFTQTDMIVQLCSNRDFVNRWVFKTDSFPRTSHDDDPGGAGIRKMISEERIYDISSAVRDWATVTDVHSGFQRLDGRNLMGFMDAVSQPDRLKSDIIWTTSVDETGFSCIRHLYGFSKN